MIKSLLPFTYTRNNDTIRDMHRALSELIDAHNAPILERVRATEAYQNLAKQIK